MKCDILFNCPLGPWQSAAATARLYSTRHYPGRYAQGDDDSHPVVLFLSLSYLFALSLLFSIFLSSLSLLFTLQFQVSG